MVDVPGMVVKAGASWTIDKLKKRLDHDIGEARQQATQEMAQVGYAVGRAVVAVAMRRDPTDDEVDAFFAEAVGDPRFPARVFRLLVEAYGTSSKEKRRRLAAVLWGGPKAVPAPSELERFDAMVPSLFDQDIALFKALADATARLRTKENVHPDIGATTRGGGEVVYFPLGQPERPTRVRVDFTTLGVTTLELAGCLKILSTTQHQPTQNGPVHSDYTLVLKPLGEFVVEVLRREPIASVLAEAAQP